MSKLINRREFLVNSSLISGLMLMGGCDPLSLREKNKSINFYGTGTLNIPNKAWDKLFFETGITSLFRDNGNSPGPIIAQMLSGSARYDYDVGGMLGGAEKKLSSDNAIIPWDLSKISNWKTVWQWGKNIEHAKIGGNQYGLPLVVNADSMIYLPDKVKTVRGYESGVIDSYSAIFDPELKGKVAMEDAWVNSVIFTAIYLKQNNLIKINDPGNLTESELREVMTFLIEKKKEGQFKKLWSGWEQGVELLRSGEVWAMTGWEPIVKALVDQGINAKYAEPKEGYEGWSIDLILHSGVVDNDKYETCHAFANWLYAGYYGAILANSRGYAVPNTTTLQYVEEFPKVKETINHVRNKISSTVFWQNVHPDNFRLYEEWWSKLRSV